MGENEQSYDIDGFHRRPRKIEPPVTYDDDIIVVSSDDEETVPSQQNNVNLESRSLQELEIKREGIRLALNLIENDTVCPSPQHSMFSNETEAVTPEPCTTPIRSINVDNASEISTDPEDFLLDLDFRPSKPSTFSTSKVQYTVNNGCQKPKNCSPQQPQSARVAQNNPLPINTHSRKLSSTKKNNDSISDYFSTSKASSKASSKSSNFSVDKNERVSNYIAEQNDGGFTLNDILTSEDSRIRKIVVETVIEVMQNPNVFPNLNNGDGENRHLTTPPKTAGNLQHNQTPNGEENMVENCNSNRKRNANFNTQPNSNKMPKLNISDKHASTSKSAISPRTATVISTNRIPQPNLNKMPKLNISDEHASTSKGVFSPRTATSTKRIPRVTVTDTSDNFSESSASTGSSYNLSNPDRSPDESDSSTSESGNKTMYNIILILMFNFFFNSKIDTNHNTFNIS